MARILIADDNPDVRDLLVAMFRLRGHDAEAFADGPSMLAALRAGRADLCVVDWMMPGMDGPDVLSRIRDDPDPQTATTPVAVLTSIDQPERRYVARRGAAQTFINKSTPLRRMFEDLSPYLAGR